MRIAMLVCALALTACGPSAEQSGQDEPGAPGVAASSTDVRLFDPVSKTAQAFTDTLAMKEMQRPGPNATQRYRLSAGLAHIWDIEFIDSKTAKDKIGDETLGALMTAPDDAKVTIYSVTQEILAPGTANGGLCAPDKTGFLVLAESGDDLHVAAFKGDAWPPADAKGLCGTFNYVTYK